ncbi:DALR anticodon-binding domain-containing protein [Cupriavidus basilensis]
MDLALEARRRLTKPPVYCVQYARAHVCSVFERAGVDPASLTNADLAAPVSGPEARTSAPQATALVQRLAAFPDMLAADAARELAPHAAAFYLRDLAGDFHARLQRRSRAGRSTSAVERLPVWRSLAATRRVLRNGLAAILACPRRKRSLDAHDLASRTALA